VKVYVAYLRVSTDKQGVHGLGIEAQREAHQKWGAARNATCAAEFVEAESGKKPDRPELAKARALARARKCTLVVAKLDRLARDVDLIREVVNSKEDVAFCDFPQIPEGPVGKFMVTMLAAAAEFEGGMTGVRTKAAMAAAKARGQKFGNIEALRRYHAERTKPHDTTKALDACSDLAIQRVQDVAPQIRLLQQEGHTTLGALADALNDMGITAPRGGKWYKTTVQRVLRALPDQPTAGVTDVRERNPRPGRAGNPRAGHNSDPAARRDADPGTGAHAG
jgi:DNA invertase Pin-like site-specific DNA recombinase